MVESLVNKLFVSRTECTGRPEDLWAETGRCKSGTVGPLTSHRCSTDCNAIALGGFTGLLFQSSPTLWQQQQPQPEPRPRSCRAAPAPEWATRPVNQTKREKQTPREKYIARDSVSNLIVHVRIILAVRAARRPTQSILRLPHGNAKVWKLEPTFLRVYLMQEGRLRYGLVESRGRFSQAAECEQDGRAALGKRLAVPHNGASSAAQHQ
ncbi:hypothetical protein CBL_07242 [Carabus blaptoides fortunei]